MCVRRLSPTRRPAAVLPALALLAGLAVACDLSPPTPKAVVAERTGNLSGPLAPRVTTFAAALVTACGDGLPTEAGEGRLERLPYVQYVTTDAATVMWTDGRARTATLEVRAPGGDLVARLDAEADSAALTRDHQFEVRFGGLAPATVYCYQVLDGDAPLTTPAGFRTAPEAGPLRFLAFGDAGDGSPEQHAAMEQMRTVDYDLVLVLGDTVYDWGTPGQLEAFFFDVYADILRHVPAFPVAGNHDYKTADAAPLRSFFALPPNGGDAGRERSFSFDWGDAHFVGFDSEVVGDDQLAWLEADLAGSAKPWKIVYLHRPLTDFSGREGTGWRATLFEILQRQEVPLVLAGHYHLYSRAFPVGGVYRVITGSAGRELHTVRDTPELSFGVAVVHFSFVTIDGDTLTLHAIDATGHEFDQLVIRRPPAGEPAE